MARPRTMRGSVGEGDRPAVGQGHEVGLASRRGARRGAGGAGVARRRRGAGGAGVGVGAGVGAAGAGAGRRLERAGCSRGAARPPGPRARRSARPCVGLEEHEAAAADEAGHRDPAPVLQDQDLRSGGGRRGSAHGRDRSRGGETTWSSGTEKLSPLWSGRAPGRRGGRAASPGSCGRPSGRAASSAARPAPGQEQEGQERRRLRSQALHGCSGLRGNLSQGRRTRRAGRITLLSHAQLGRGPRSPRRPRR